MSLRIGIDTGGTFTDLVLAEGNCVRVAAKSLTTYEDLANGLLRTLNKAECDYADVAQVVHGTTVALNAILTRNGANVGQICTRGYRDAMDMARGWRPAEALVDPRWRRSHEIRPIVERHRRRSVSERVLADGRVLVPLDEEGLLREVSELVADGCQSIAVCFLHAYKHPAHEQRAAELIRVRFPDISVCTSSDIAPFPREYNRFSTCVLNAFVQPLMESYSQRIAGRLHEAGLTAPLSFMTNDGGLSSPDQVSSRPVATLNSGPVGGVMGVQEYSRHLCMPNLVGFDMGGTSTEVAVVVEGRASTKRELEIEHDVIVSLPVLEIHSIGSGGGSIVSLDEAGGLRVGPESAGSTPGPACYGRGGLPTVTDAFLLLGILDPDVALGGEIHPDLGAAEKAFRPLAETLGIETVALAGTVAEVAIHNMAEAVRRLTIYRGVDPREFGLLAYGAAGPLVATQVARALQMPRVVVPALSGVFSAFGLLSATASDELVVPVMTLAGDAVVKELFSRARQELKQLGEKLSEQGHSITHTECVVDATYRGQRWELAVPVDPAHEDPFSHLKDSFAAAHEKQYGYSLPAEVYVQTLRARAFAASHDSVLPAPLQASAPSIPCGHRDMVIKGRRHHNVPVYAADAFAPDQSLTGPAVIEASTYTALLIPGDVAKANSVGDLIIELQEEQA